MILDEIIERYKSNAEYERTHGNLQGCLEFRQLVKWLESLKQYKEKSEKIGEKIDKISDILEGTIDHFDRDDAMDALYEIKRIIRE